MATLPNGDEVIVALLGAPGLVVVSGVTTGHPSLASNVTLPASRTGLVISNDGKVLLARGFNGLTVFQVDSIPPAAGSLGGTIAHSFTQTADLTDLGETMIETGREGMAISPADSSRAVVVTPGSPMLQLIAGLPANPVLSQPVSVPGGIQPYTVSITPNGKFAIVGTDSGLLMYSGVDSGTLQLVGSLYNPVYKLGSGTTTLSAIRNVAITLDGNYVVITDAAAQALVVIPITADGFAASPASALGSIAVPDNDQMIIH